MRSWSATRVADHRAGVVQAPAGVVVEVVEVVVVDVEVVRGVLDVVFVPERTFGPPQAHNPRPTMAATAMDAAGRSMRFFTGSLQHVGAYRCRTGSRRAWGAGGS
jgi:hypothetical protein